MPAADGYFVLSVANDPTFRALLRGGGLPRTSSRTRGFATAVERVRNRDEVTDTLNEITRTRTVAWWLERLEAAGVGNGAINTLEEVFRRPAGEGPRDGGGDGPPRDRGTAGPSSSRGPIKLSGTPVTYRQSPPTLGQHTDEVLGERLGLGAAELRDLRDRGIV